MKNLVKGHSPHFAQTLCNMKTVKKNLLVFKISTYCCLHFQYTVACTHNTAGQKQTAVIAYWKVSSYCFLPLRGRLSVSSLKCLKWQAFRRCPWWNRKLGRPDRQCPRTFPGGPGNVLGHCLSELSSGQSIKRGPGWLPLSKTRLPQHQWNCQNIGIWHKFSRVVSQLY